MPDRTDKVILEHLGSLGYAITVTAGCIEAVHEQTGELHRVRFDDKYKAACQLARLVGIDLLDGSRSLGNDRLELRSCEGPQRLRSDVAQ